MKFSIVHGFTCGPDKTGLVSDFWSVHLCSRAVSTTTGCRHGTRRHGCHFGHPWRCLLDGLASRASVYTRVVSKMALAFTGRVGKANCMKCFFATRHVNTGVLFAGASPGCPCSRPRDHGPWLRAVITGREHGPWSHSVWTGAREHGP